MSQRLRKMSRPKLGTRIIKGLNRLAEQYESKSLPYFTPDEAKDLQKAIKWIGQINVWWGDEHPIRTTRRGNKT